jgi:hypothetical protein
MAKSTPRALGTKQRPSAARKPAKGRRPSAARRPVAKPPTPRWAGERADYGQPIDGFFARQPPQLRPILEALRELVEAAAPEAASSTKWGMPFYTIGGEMFCALGAHKAHVNLIMVGPPDGFADPKGRLEGSGRGGRHLKLASLDELPRAAVRGWLRTAATWARGKR